MDNDNALTNFYEHGSNDAFAQFEKEFRHLIRGWVYRSLPRKLACRQQVVEELTQDILVKVHKSCGGRNQWDARRSKVTTWLKTIACNRSVDFLRRKPRKSVLAADLEQPRKNQEAACFADSLQDTKAPLPESDLQRAEMRKSLHNALGKLPEADQRKLKMYYWQDLTLARIAEIEGVTTASVFRSLRRAENQLKADLGSWDIGA